MEAAKTQVEVNWAQSRMVGRDNTDPYANYYTYAVPVPAGATVAAVHDALRPVVGRHLGTTYRVERVEDGFAYVTVRESLGE